MKGIFASLKSIMEKFIPDWKKSGGVSEVRAERLRKVFRRQATDKRKAKHRWQWMGIVVEANTKSEARARLKNRIDEHSVRLPVGANVVLVS